MAPRGSQAISCRLVIARGQKEGQQFVISSAEARLGRADSCDVVLTDPGVSNVHARVLFREGRWWVEDLASQNGTLLNGSKISGPQALKTGDAIALGTVLVGFADVGDAHPRAKVVPQGVAVSSRRPTGDVLMPGLPARKAPPGRKDSHDVATASGEGGPTVNFEDLDAELTSPSGLNVRDLAARAEQEAAPRARGNDATNTDLPVIDDDGGPPTIQPGAKLEGSTHVGPAPARAEPVLVPRPSVPSRPQASAPLVPRPSGPTGRPPTHPPGLVPKSGPSRIPDEPEVTHAGPSPRPEPLLVPRPSAPRASEVETGPRPEPVLVPRPSAPRSAEGDTGPRLGTPMDLEGQKTSLKPQGLEELNTVARAPIVPEHTPVLAKPIHEETKIHSVGTPSALKPPSSTRPVVPTVPEPVESAADKARRRREASQSVWLAIAFKWSELPRRAQQAAMVGGGVLGLLAVAAVVLASQASPGPRLGPEPTRLNFNEAVGKSFGYGPDVQYENPVEKSFTFELNAPTEAAVVVHLRGASIGREELAVAANGHDVGFVPEDFGNPQRELEVLVPPRALLRGQDNIITFTNAKSDGKEPWSIFDVRLELLALPPEAREGQSFDEARKLVKQANDLLQSQERPTMNVYKAWRFYRQAWILLLGLPEEKRTNLFPDARFKHAELGRELDQKCGAYLLEAKKQMELKFPDRAREILEEVPMHFPGKEHPCQTLAKEKLAEYEL